MITATAAVILAISALLAVPAAVIFAEVMLALGYRPAPGAGDPARPACTVLMPAHNEAAGIRRTLDGLRPQLRSGDRLLVVADNCSDDTARIAADAGAEVIQRHDLARRGKGYALDFGVQHLAAGLVAGPAAGPPPIVIIADADCDFAPGALDILVRACAAAARPVQALYLMRSAHGAALGTRVAEFAWLVKNQVRPTGLLRLALPCQLMGSGMAFPWDIIREARLASSNLVEDLQLGLDLVRAGRPPLFCPQALISSVFPQSAAGLASQRTRWEHGHLSLIVSEALPMLLAGFKRADTRLLALGLDLLVPPLALLTLLSVCCLAAAVILALATGVLAPLVLAGMTCALIGAAVLASWLRWGRAVISAGHLLRAPWYVLMKIPTYARFLVSRQVEWVRSRRDADP